MASAMLSGNPPDSLSDVSTCAQVAVVPTKQHANIYPTSHA
jgi:hypothetical protein